MDEKQPHVINVADAEDIWEEEGPWGGSYKVLSPPRVAGVCRLGVNVTRLRKGHTACPFHYHMREDEVFYVLSGRGVLRYGDTLREIEPGDCVFCPAGSKVAHQIANPYDEDLVYLGIGNHDPHEVCVYPDSGKVMVAALGQVGFLRKTPYMEGEPEQPRIFELISQAGTSNPGPRR